MAEKSRGWLGFRTFSDQTNRLVANDLQKINRKIETDEKLWRSSSKIFRKNLGKKLEGFFAAYVTEPALLCLI